MSFKRFNPKILLILAYVCVLASLLAWYALIRTRQQPTVVQNFSSVASEKVYIAVEEEGKVAVLNPENEQVEYIDLSKSVDGMVHKFAPHNVQVAPDGKSVWVTGNVAGSHQHGSNFLKRLAEKFHLFEKAYADSGHGDASDHMADAEDEVIVIDPLTDQISQRRALGSSLHLSHVALTPDSKYAFIAAQEKDTIFKMNTRTFEVEKAIKVDSGSAPHGLRISPDGKTAYVAMTTGKSLALLDTASSEVTYVKLKGQAIQTGITPDGMYAFASVYDAKALAVFNPPRKQLTYVDLPAEAKGPVQVYASSDSRYVYVADQGYYFEQPTNNKVYKVDLMSSRVVASIPTGTAPHGVVTSKDGRKVFVTNLLSDDVSVIDTAKDVETSRVKVGGQPNGVSVWSKENGGTP